METVTTLDDKVRAFKVLLDKKDELAEQTKGKAVPAVAVGRTGKKSEGTGRLMRWEE